MTSLSSTEKETASPCVPSRRVVSNVKIFISHLRARRSLTLLLGRGGRGILRDAGLFLLLKERHHGAQFAAHVFDALVLFRLAHRQKFLAPGAVLVHPLAGEFAGLDLRKNFLHLGARLLVDDS